MWGRDRDVAIARMIRALEEMEIEGIATVIPADLAILRHPDFAAIEHSTKWVETVLDLTGVGATPGAAAEGDDDEPKVKRSMDVEVNGKRFEVVPVRAREPAGAATAGGARPRPKRKRGGSGGGRCRGGLGPDRRAHAGHHREGQRGRGPDRRPPVTPVVVLEAMKMENNVAADIDGTVTEIKVEAGQSVAAGDVVVVIEPAE